MKYQIAYDTLGRIRLRCGQYAFTKEQGNAVQTLLLLQDCVKEAVVNASSGRILVYYEKR